MAKKTTKRKIVGLVSTVTGHRIYTTKNTQNSPDKLRRRAYDPIARMHVWFEETKKNLGRNEVKARKG